MSKVHTFKRDDIEAFKAQWPCNGFPDSLASIRFEFADNGDLVDIVAKSRNGRPLDTHAFDGPALAALADDARRIEPETPVIFRIERRKGGDVTAVFPCEPHNMSGRDMTCYAHVGQHGACSFGWFAQGAHRLAKPAEYAELKRELESAPYVYRLKVYRRLQRWMRDAFQAELKRLQSLGNR